MEEENKQNWFFTFCSYHDTPNQYVKIFGTYGSARNKMAEKFGMSWCFQYIEKEFIGQVDEFHLTELKIGE